MLRIYTRSSYNSATKESKQETGLKSKELVNLPLSRIPSLYPWLAQRFLVHSNSPSSHVHVLQPSVNSSASSEKQDKDEERIIFPIISFPWKILYCTDTHSCMQLQSKLTDWKRPTPRLKNILPETGDGQQRRKVTQYLGKKLKYISKL